MTNEEFVTWAGRYITLKVLQERYKITALALTEKQLSDALHAIGEAYFASVYSGVEYSDELEMSMGLQMSVAAFVFAYVSMYTLTATKYATAKGTHEGSTTPTADDVSAQVSKHRRIGVMFLVPSKEFKEAGLTLKTWQYSPILGEEL